MVKWCGGVSVFSGEESVILKLKINKNTQYEIAAVINSFAMTKSLFYIHVEKR